MKKRKIISLLVFLSLSFGRPGVSAGGEVPQNKFGDNFYQSDMVITSLAPSQAFNSGVIQYTIDGEGFPAHIGVKLIRNEVEIPGLDPEVSAGNRIQCFFDLSGKPFGDYDLVLTTPDGERSIYKGAFQIRIFLLVYEINSLIKPIFFDYDQFRIREDQGYVLQGNMKLLFDNPYYYILLEGYTDPQGSREYNLRLSVKRVESVRQMLVEAGIPESRIFTCHHIEKSASLKGSVEKDWGMARRVDIRLSETPPYKGD